MAEYLVILAVERILGELIQRDFNNLPEIQGRIELIQMNLRKLRSLLEIADSSQEVDEAIRKWVAETREVVYEIEDLLLLANSSRNDAGFFRRFNLFRESNHHLEPRIELVEKKISTLESDVRVRNIKGSQMGVPNPVSKRIHLQRRTYSHQVEEDFVGFEGDLGFLVEKLVEVGAEKESHVLTITGMGGIGKTTLAKKIYHHVDVRTHFQAFSWICISQQWQIEDVLLDILEKLDPEKRKKIKRMKVNDMVRELYNLQLRKRCLVVLDDVWDTYVWDVLKPAFPTRQNLSKVLITTRKIEIYRHIETHTSCYRYEQRYLNENESWELLKRKIGRWLDVAGETDEPFSSNEDDDGMSSPESFHSCQTDEEDESIGYIRMSSSEDSIQDRKDHLDMEKLGREMVARCAGLPLAIVVLGGVLKTKSTVNEWRTVHRNFYSFSNGPTSLENARVHEVLSLSYHDLPYQLKPCFLHLGNFPEDYKIPTLKLYSLWAAEGFISSESRQGEEQESIMDTGERYLGELVQRCMVQVQVDEITRRFKFCQLSDFTRELCLVKGKQENFLKRVPIRHESGMLPSPSSATAASICVIRRLSIAVEADFDSYFPKESLGHVRSALFFSRLPDRRNLEVTLNSLCNESKLIRVLGLERFDLGEKLTKAIGNLVHLRYLSLRGCLFHKLPSSIANLKNLQTLDLRVPFFVCLTIPKDICKLNQLRHLYLPPSHKSKDKLRVSSLSSLEILKNYDSRVSDYNDICKLTMLKKFAAILEMDTENLEKIVAYLSALSTCIRASSLRIRHFFQSERELLLLRRLVGCIHLHKLDLNGTISELPEHGVFSQSLVKLTLRNSMLKQDPMPILERLPNLRSLILRRNVIEMNEFCCSPQGFPQLRLLEFQGLAKLEHWWIERGCMPKLHSLKIDECINLRMVPEGIRFITTLKELVVANMPDSFNHRIQKVDEEAGEDYHKIERILSVKIIETRADYAKQLERQQSGTSYSLLLKNVAPSLIPKEWDK